MIVPVNKKEFLKYTKKFIFDIFKQTKNFNSKKNIVIEQGGNFWSPVSSTIFYGNNRKIVLVSRDPKAIYSSMKNRNSLSYPGNDLKIFVKWYKNIMLKIDKNQHNKIIKIEFEKFFGNFKIESKKFCKLLKIKNDTKNKFNLDNTYKNLHKYKKYLSKKEIDYINKHLSEYIK